MFTQVWKKTYKHQYADWVAKVDADAVFIPNRLRTWLSHQLVPENGIYLENCKFVEYGYFGNLEVFSKAAYMTLLANIDQCKASPEINWKLGVHDGKYGPMGEDLFAQTCLDEKGVRRVEAFDITTDGACPADRPQNQRKNKHWKPDCAKTNHTLNMQAFITLALVAAASAAPQYAAAHVVHAVAAPDLAEPSPYTYTYAVADDYSKANFQQAESNDGTGAVTGSYSVNLPDGRIQTVTYTANDLTGNVATVEYSGEA